MPKRMVGREPQLEELQRLYGAAAGGSSRLILVGGDTGGGKTTLVHAFASRLAGADVAVELTECVPLEGLAYAPISQLLRRMIDVHGADRVLAWAGASRGGLSALLPDLVATPVAPETLRLQLYEAVAHVIEQASRVRPLVLIIEDLHWADQSTRQLLGFLTRALVDAPVLMIMTFRRDELTRRHPVRTFLAEIGRLPQVRRIELPRLNRDEVAELLINLIGRDPDQAMIDLILQRSEGVPYFIEELVRSSQDGRDCLPDSLRDALELRIQALSDETQAVLRIAAIGGIRVDHALLEGVVRVSGRTTAAELDDALREATDAQLLRTDETGYVFSHALLQETISEDVLPGQRARLHANYATVLEAMTELPERIRLTEIARHWFGAHDQKLAFSWALRAARTDDVAAHESLLMYDRVLELWDQVAEPEAIAGARTSVLQAAAEQALAAVEPERALALINESLAESAADDHEGTAARLMIKARLLATVIRPGSVAAARQAMALVPAEPPTPLRAEVLNRLAMDLMLEQGDRTEGLAVARELIDLSRRLELPVLESHGHNTVGCLLVAAGEEEAGLAELALAEPLARGDASTMIRYYINGSDTEYWSGRYRAAAATARAGMDAALGLGLDRTMGAMLAGNAAWPLIALGNWAEAGRVVDAALRLVPPAKHRTHLRMIRGWLTLWSGDVAAAEQVLAEFRSMITEDLTSPQYGMLALGLELWLGRWTDDPERAWRATGQVLRNWDRLHGAMVFEPLAVAAWAARLLDGGSGERVEVVRDRLRHSLPMTIRGYWEPVIEAELEGTVETWRRAWTATAASSAPVVIRPYVGLQLARVLADAGTSDADVITEATTAATALGSGLLVGALREAGRRAGLVPTDENAAPAGPLDGLTPREREVLTLVAKGRTNGEIARELVISTKTASVHVSNILTKFGVTNRGEAAALAHQLTPAQTR
ncbi:AAA family ATPase [Microlunatus sp. GCM10028923]|uniref:helix-turn-helix transcriptional regulator n=1 Tax=Microlunatus sp. GCM10028923 TaxID=3273400 RepID=UPI0036167FC8